MIDLLDTLMAHKEICVGMAANMIGVRKCIIAFVGDDYGCGGNDESVYKSDFKFITIDDYTKLSEVLAPWLDKE